MVRDMSVLENKYLNKDIQLKHTGYGFWEPILDKDGFQTCSHMKSLENAIVLAILTRYQELQKLPTYVGFGCRVHEMIKARQTRLNKFKIQTYLEKSIGSMNRVETVDNIELTPYKDGYEVEVYLTSVDGETVHTKVNLS